MKIETKYNKGDEVYFVDNNKAKKGIIKSIKIFAGKRITGHTDEVDIEYEVIDINLPIPENKLFTTKDQLVESIMLDLSVDLPKNPKL